MDSGITANICDKIKPITYGLLPFLAIITTVSGLREAVRDFSREHERFTVTASVAFHSNASDTMGYIITDGTNFVHLACATGIAMRVGDAISAQGMTVTELNGLARLAYATAVTKTGTAPVPPPIDILPSQLSAAELCYRPVRMTGEVIDALQDEIDSRNMFITLRGTNGLFYACFESAELDFIRSLQGARVSITGYVSQNPPGVRKHLDVMLSSSNRSQLTVISPPLDPFDVKPLRRTTTAETSFSSAERRRAEGTVVAVWQTRNILLLTDDGQTVRAALQAGIRPPSVNDHITVTGFLDTDLFHLVLTRATFKSTPGKPIESPDPIDTSASDILSPGHSLQRTRILQGHPARIVGEVVAHPVSTSDSGTFTLANGHLNISVDISSCQIPPRTIQPGSTVSVTGLCILESDRYSPYDVFPKIHGVTLVVRRADDIAVIANPPWWTLKRLVLALLVSAVLLVAFLVWNRILARNIYRKSRQLLRSEIAQSEYELKIAERTRLAAEIHDSISQTLTGISFQIDAAQQTLHTDPSTCARFLDVSRQTLSSCREELRRCLWDLRSNVIEDCDLSNAIERTLKPHIGAAALQIRFNTPRSLLSDSTLHAILSIVRELSANAIRHGHATVIKIAGEKKDNVMRFSVRDNGCGFDPANRLGPSQGHFGLQGIRERINRMGGALVIESKPGEGTRVCVEIGK